MPLFHLTCRSCRTVHATTERVSAQRWRLVHTWASGHARFVEIPPLGAPGRDLGPAARARAEA